MSKTKFVIVYTSIVVACVAATIMNIIEQDTLGAACSGGLAGLNLAILLERLSRE